jgi:protein gp37
MINIEKGRYWDLPLSLVSGCTPCSPGCDHCWSLAMGNRFGTNSYPPLAHPERLDIPLKRRKPTVYAIWNDFWHESVPDDFQYKAYDAMVERHTFLILTKRPHIAAAYYREGKHDDLLPRDNIYHGLTICNQQEADEKQSDFKKVPGKKFLSLEPLLSDIPFLMLDEIDCVILGGETGPGARPMHPDWVRSVRDDCQSAGVSFFFKSWGKNTPDLKDCFGDQVVSPYSALAMDVSRLLDGRTHDDLPWVTP